MSTPRAPLDPVIYWAIIIFYLGITYSSAMLEIIFQFHGFGPLNAAGKSVEQYNVGNTYHDSYAGFMANYTSSLEDSEHTLKHDIEARHVRSSAIPEGRK